MPMLELYHWEPTAHSARALIALKEKGVDFVSRYVDLLRFEQHSPRFAALNPNRRVPVLVHDGTVITEPTALLEYVDETFPGVALRPPDPEGRVLVRDWAEFLDEHCSPSLGMLGWHRYVATEIAARDRAELQKTPGQTPAIDRKLAWATALADSYTEADLEDSRRRLTAAAKRVEDALSSSRWLIRDAYSLADISAFAMLNTLPRLLPEVVNARVLPATFAWLARMRERPAVQEALLMGRRQRPNEAPAPGSGEAPRR
jgi:GSH-dependent disulfide-bond oxidoreductase